MKLAKHKYTLVSQVAANIPRNLVPSLAKKHGVDKQARTFSPWSHLVSMIFAHLTHALSLNDVCDALRLHSGALSTIRGATPPSRNGLSHANKVRSADFAKDVFYEVLGRLTSQYPKFGRTDVSFKPPRGLKRTINLLDSTTIQLFANCMDWAKHRRRKAAAKCHLLLDAKTFLPRFAVVKSASSSDAVEGRSICSRLRDGEIELEGPKSRSDYPERFRLIVADVVRDGKVGRMEFITNDLSLAASTIADLYKSRWDIKLFFKQLKQTLKLSDFLGYSENAVKWQIWTALLCYLVLRFIAFTNRWKGTFARLFTIIRGGLWSRLYLSSLLKCYGTASNQTRRILPPIQLYLPLFTT